LILLISEIAHYIPRSTFQLIIPYNYYFRALVTLYTFFISYIVLLCFIVPRPRTDIIFSSRRYHLWNIKAVFNDASVRVHTVEVT